MCPLFFDVWSVHKNPGANARKIWNTGPLRLTVSVTCFSFTISAVARAWPTDPGAEGAFVCVHFLFTALPANVDLRDLVRALLVGTAGMEELWKEESETEQRTGVVMPLVTTLCAIPTGSFHFKSKNSTDYSGNGMKKWSYG